MRGLRVAGWATNLSRGGLALRFFGALDPGVQVCVSLHRDRRPALTCVGRVAWVDRSFQPGDATAGIAFTAGLSEDVVADITSETDPLRADRPGVSPGEL